MHWADRKSEDVSVSQSQVSEKAEEKMASADAMEAYMKMQEAKKKASA
jgi:hypothetical protein